MAQSANLAVGRGGVRGFDVALGLLGDGRPGLVFGRGSGRAVRHNSCQARRAEILPHHPGRFHRRGKLGRGRRRRAGVAGTPPTTARSRATLERGPTLRSAVGVGIRRSRLQPGFARVARGTVRVRRWTEPAALRQNLGMVEARVTGQGQGQGQDHEQDFHQSPPFRHPWAPAQCRPFPSHPQEKAAEGSAAGDALETWNSRQSSTGLA